MSRLPLSDIGATPFERLLGHNSKLLKQWESLELFFFQSPTFDKEFLEQVRRALAFINQCRYCMAKAGPPDKNLSDARLLEAMRFANQFALSHEPVDQKIIERLRKYFDEAEIVELIAFCSFISASQKFGAALGLEATS